MSNKVEKGFEEDSKLQSSSLLDRDYGDEASGLYMAVCPNPCSQTAPLVTLCAPCALLAPGSVAGPCALHLVRGPCAQTLCAVMFFFGPAQGSHTLCAPLPGRDLHAGPCAQAGTRAQGRAQGTS